LEIKSLKLILSIDKKMGGVLFMVEESVRCARCDKWFKREKEEAQQIKKSGKINEDLCPECDDEIKE
jgi:hypothetical protein